MFGEKLFNAKGRIAFLSYLHGFSFLFAAPIPSVIITSQTETTRGELTGSVTWLHSKKRENIAKTLLNYFVMLLSLSSFMHENCHSNNYSKSLLNWITGNPHLYGL